MEKRLVIIGGGFAGITLAQEVEKQLPPEWTILLLSKENYMTYNPLLPEAVGASVLPSHVVAPLRQLVKHTRVYMVTVTDIDFVARQIYYLGEGSGVITYDQLVFACGTVANLHLVPGLDKYALPLKTLGDALFIRNRIMSRLEHADMQVDVEMRRWLSTFIIIGGGFSGVEVAGEIIDCLHEAVNYYPHIRREDCQVILLHNSERILPELSPTSGDYALRKMHKNGVEFWLNAKVARVDDQGVWLQSGESIRGGTVICTIGSAPNPLIENLPLAKQRGRISTNTDMSVPEYPDVWAIGDCAAVMNAHDGQYCPPTAQFATRQAKQLAANIVRALQGQVTQDFCYQSQGQLSSIGHNSAVAEVFGFRFYGFIGWLLWRGVYLLKLPTFARKLRIFMEWNWQMLFPPDIVHLRFSRSSRTTNAKKELPERGNKLKAA